MANICMDSVAFYSKNEKQKDELLKLKNALDICYPAGTTSKERYFKKIFDYLKLDTYGMHVRGDIVYYSSDDDCVALECDSAWSPMYEAYCLLGTHFHVNFVMSAEEPSSNIYINTDYSGRFLITRYKVQLHKRPDDGSLDNLYKALQGDKEIFFESCNELLKWFREKAEISAGSLPALRKKLNPDYVTIYKFTNPYHKVTAKLS